MGLVNKKKTTELFNPVRGNVVPLSSVHDEVFASEAMGTGFGVFPSSGEIYSPTKATVTAIFPTKHAISLVTKNGMEILIHIGIDTVQLKGVGFQVLVEEGQRVSSGESLVIFDCDQIKAEKLSDVVMVLFPEDKGIKLEVSEK